MNLTALTNIRSFRGVSPSIASSAYIDPYAVVIGDVQIGEDSSMWPMSVARGDAEAIRLGARTNVQDGAVLHAAHHGPHTGRGIPLIIGDDVTVGHAAVVHACTVEDACLIGTRATVLDRVLMRKHSWVGAGAVVLPDKVVGSGELWLGNPARKVRNLTDAERELTYYFAQYYAKLKMSYV